MALALKQLTATRIWIYLLFAFLLEGGLVLSQLRKINVYDLLAIVAFS